MSKSIHRRTPLDWFYDIGVIIKGIDGAIEFLAGLVLWISPRVVHLVLTAIAGEAREGKTATRHFIAGYVARLDSQLARSGLVFLIVFLVIHGAVKLALVYCLLRKIHRAYPIALAVLTAFLAYQIYALVTAPSIGFVIFTVLDAIIIYLVYREYRVIKPRPNAPS